MNSRTAALHAAAALLALAACAPTTTDDVALSEADAFGVRGNAAAPLNSVPADEAVLIDAWLKAHADSLNEFGDTVGTMYGGAAVVDDASIQHVSRYEYIVRRHPGRPWRR